MRKGLALALAGAALLPSAAHAAGCGDLLTARIAHVTVLDASERAPGLPMPLVRTGVPVARSDLPGYCRVRAVAMPVKGSRIGFELWLPLVPAWNGRFRMVGNGGYSSAMSLDRLAAGVRTGYAMAATDTGHDGDDPEFAVGRPPSIDDWGHRAVHETAVAAKAFALAFYGRAPVHSYFDGCSTGGHQALMEAQRYPADFDGIVAGAPGSNRTRLNIGFLWQFAVNHRRAGPSTPILPASKLRLLTAGALAACGSASEQAAGFLNNPFTCRFDPAVLRCKGKEGPECLAGEQVEVARRMYAGARNPRTGAQIYPPWLPGSESYGPPGFPLPGWSLYWADPERPAQPARANFFRFWVFGDPAWDWRSFDFDRDIDRMASLAARIDATNPDLEPFRRAGGKLIQYHGLADPVVSPWDSRRYYEQVEALQGARTGSFYRLFFVPGMAHCGGGPGFDRLDPTDAIEAWVERGTPPASLTAPRSRTPGTAGSQALLPYAGAATGR